MSNFVADKHYYVDESKSIIVEESDPRAAFLLVAKGHELIEAEARRYGLVKGDDTMQAKANTGPPENKAQQGPIENKAEDAGNLASDESQSQEPGDEPEDLESHTVIELREIAKQEGVALTGLTAKADIIAAIQLHRE